MNLSKAISAKSGFKCCSPLLSGIIQPDEAAQMAAVFRVLGEPARLRLLSIIAMQPNQEVCACELVEPLGLSQPTVSHHLKVLHESGLLAKERRGTWIYYQLIPEQLAAIQKALIFPVKN
ncbi:transcriptional regulator [Calothrix sp. NIES-4101]|uniref:ArsR/SmtB family transcription factor n=1 Tax=Calothrix sp. UHCC 0171 TaxID=3110245 RepID=UPI000B607B81|nr:metalloregulator ArsR/SmtB family transcription factor [Calothrix sp. UHCC 0171]MEA5571733.1 metalloregulator ArsR/SmtB family transcription factor [Calothrix sp. UHCC 0171]BAZ38240.1 transcriptional regulator [Calothrix sp. NIES-4101]